MGFASCSTDGTVRPWDSRGKKTPVLSMQAHADEVNVLSWNSHVTHLLASGADDGVWKVHDLRAAGQGGEAAGKAGEVFSFGFHKQPITSVEWSPFEDSMICLPRPTRMLRPCPTMTPSSRACPSSSSFSIVA